jgi:glycosyltransferase involved in cell wall biosynthesis
MRIVLIIPDLRGGGAERSTVTLAKGLAARGHAVHILLFYRAVDYPLPDGVEVHVLTQPKRRMRFGWLDKRLLAWALKRWLARYGPFDISVAILSFASEVAYLAGANDAWHQVHGTLSAEIAGLAPDRRRMARRLARYRRIFDGRRVIAVSDGVARDLGTRIGLRRSHIVTIYNPHDLAEIRRLAAAGEPDIHHRPFVLHAGRFTKGKRHDLLFDAFLSSGIPHDLVLLTDQSDGLRRLIESRGLSRRVLVVGFRPNPFPWYARASALVLSSDHEGLPNVLIEALAVGIPVVSTDCPSGPREILVGNLGAYLSPVGDVQGLARNLRATIEAPPHIDARIVNKFDMRHAVDRFENLHRRPFSFDRSCVGCMQERPIL